MMVRISLFGRMFLLTTLTLMAAFPRPALAESPFGGAPARISEDSSFEDASLTLKLKDLKRDMEYLKNKANAEAGIFTTLSVGPLTITLSRGEKHPDRFPEVTFGLVGGGQTSSISTTGERCQGETLKGGAKAYVSGEMARCTARSEPGKPILKASTGVGVGIGADAASLALTAGGFVKVPIDLKSLVEFVTPESPSR